MSNLSIVKSKDKQDPSLPEYCVGLDCNHVFDYPKSTHIHNPKRKGRYIEGAGQLCDTCAEKMKKAFQ